MELRQDSMYKKGDLFFFIDLDVLTAQGKHKMS